MKKYILITGASSGIGLEMARILANKKYDLILVARSEKKLQALKQELESSFGVEVNCILADLSDELEVAKVYKTTEENDWLVSHLVNNAGVGLYGKFLELDALEELKMIDLNVRSLTLLCKLYGRSMASRNDGKILNVASLLSFLPFPYYSVYSATKAYVLALSETLDAELEENGVRVLALCPGPVDTGFTTESMLKTRAYKTNKPASAVSVAHTGVEFLLNGKGVKVVGAGNRLLSFLPRITPSAIMKGIKKSLAQPQ